MPTNKNAYLRYRIIDECLRNRIKYFNRDAIADRLVEKLGYEVSIHTVDKDLRAMKDEFDAPIVFDKFNNRYCYSSNFSLVGIELNQDEENALNTSLSMLDILKDTKYAKSYKGLIQKLITRANTNEKEDIIEFEQTVTQPDSDLFDTLYNAINSQNALMLTYQVFGKESREYLVSPYMIKEYRNRFYLVARKHHISSQNELIYCFGMDRIKSIHIAKEDFIRMKSFDSKSFFKHSFGITRKLNEEPIELVLKFDHFNAPYICSKPLHLSQKIVEQSADYLIISILVYESHELNMAVLSYGAGVEVLSPASYIKYIKGVVKNMRKVYIKK
jgi:predicted DNA-binding transcriptional regulator YafY